MVFGWFPWFFKVVSWVFMVFSWFPWFFKVLGRVFIVPGGFSIVPGQFYMVFHDSRLFFYCSGLVSELSA